MKQIYPPAVLIDEYQWLRSFNIAPLHVCERLGVHPRTVVRAHRAVGLAVPAALYVAERLATRGRTVAA